jgi:hypothetical protein
VRDVVVGSGQKEEQKQVEARERGFEREREGGIVSGIGLQAMASSGV